MNRASLVFLLLVTTLTACGPSTTQSLGGTVRDAHTNAPLANALVALYKGTAAASDAAASARLGNAGYIYSLVTNAAGAFTITVPVGDYSVRVFAVGYHCGAATAAGSTAVALVPNAGSDAAPVIGDTAFTPTRVIPQDAAVFTTHLSAANPNDALSHQVFLFDTGNHTVVALDAPGDMTDQGFPDGLWQTQIKAPAQLGILNYTLAVATQQCICAFATQALTVAR